MVDTREGEELFGMQMDQFARMTDEEKRVVQEAFSVENGNFAWTQQGLTAILSGVSLGYPANDLHARMIRERLGLPQNDEMPNFGGDD